MICNEVITYFVPVPGLWSTDSQRALIALWKQSWEKYGWVATCLEGPDVKSHPRFDFFNEHFQSKPTEYGMEYTTACFMRWLAAANWALIRSGHVMLTDYDCINYGFEPQEVDPSVMKIFCDEPPTSVFMGVVLGSAQHFLDMAELFAAWTPDELDWNSHAGLFHQDDVTMLTRMFDSKTRPKPPWLVKVPGCALYDYPSWRTSKLTHYGYQMRQNGFWPKHEHIQKLRPF